MYVPYHVWLVCRSGWLNKGSKLGEFNFILRSFATYIYNVFLLQYRGFYAKPWMDSKENNNK